MKEKEEGKVSYIYSVSGGGGGGGGGGGVMVSIREGACPCISFYVQLIVIITEATPTRDV